MNFQELPYEAQQALESFVGLSMDEPNFYVVGGVGLVSVLLLGRLFSHSVGQSSRNILTCFIGLTIPLLTALIVFSVSLPLYEDMLPNPDLALVASTATAAVLSVFIAFVVSKPILKMGALGIVATAFLTYGLAFTLMYGSRVVLESVGSATMDVQRKEDYIKP